MAITTTIARHYAWKTIIMGVVCVVFGVWGAFDLWGQKPLPLGFMTLRPIPYKENVMLRYEGPPGEPEKGLKWRMEEYERKRNAGTFTSQDEDNYKKDKELRDELVPGGAEPQPPGSWDKPTQWFFISSLLFAPFCFWSVISTSRRIYKLDDDGTLHLPEGDWAPGDIADIDMSRWMAKSIAHVVHKDGRRVMLDDYKHRHLHLIIGAIASRLHPESWDDQAKAIKPKAEEPPAEEAHDSGEDQEPAQSE
jgi:hypothetical protein